MVYVIQIYCSDFDPNFGRIFKAVILKRPFILIQPRWYL